MDDNKILVVLEDGSLGSISEEEYKERKLLLSSMNNIILVMNNEEAYMEWINTMPDEATEEDINYVACNNDIFEECCESFRTIMQNYGEDGFYLGGLKSW